MTLISVSFRQSVKSDCRSDIKKPSFCRMIQNLLCMFAKVVLANSQINFIIQVFHKARGK